MRQPIQGFFDFIRKQGVVGLAVGFILGGSISRLVSAFVNDIVNPLLGLALGKVEGLKSASIRIGSAEVRYGDFLGTLVDFIVIALVVYLGYKALGIEKAGEKKP